MAKIVEGAAAPDFEMESAGGSIRSGDFKGKTLVLYFYPKDDTTSCTAEAVAFDALRDGFAAAGAALVGISPDGVASHLKFKRKHGLSLTLAADETKAAIEAYGVWQEKHMWGRTYMGVERSTFLIDPAGRIARIWRKVRVRGHAAEALAAVQGLAGPFANG